MNRVFAYSLRLVCLCSLLLLLLAGPALAQPTPTPEGSPAATTVPGTATPETTTTPPGTIALPATGVAPTVATTLTTLPIDTIPLSPTLSATTPVTPPATGLAPTPTPPPTKTVEPVVPLPTAAAATATAPTTPTPAPGGSGGLFSGDGLVPLLLGGLLLLAGLAILSLLLLRRRRPARVAPARGRAATAPLAVGAEQVTGVLVPVYLELEGDPSQRFPIHGTPFAIGRDGDNDLVIDETFPQWQTVSRQHALISRHERGYVIEDLGSQNGVRVNGRLTPKNLLRTGWPIAIGGVIFRFVDETQTN